jgi:hypothetical protein
MQEKDMVLDILVAVKSSCYSYSVAMSECVNLNLKEKFAIMRNLEEKFQYDLYKIAKNKEYYTDSKLATPEEILEVKGLLTHSLTMQQGAGPIPNLK